MCPIYQLVLTLGLVLQRKLQQYTIGVNNDVCVCFSGFTRQGWPHARDHDGSASEGDSGLLRLPCGQSPSISLPSAVHTREREFALCKL